MGLIMKIRFFNNKLTFKEWKNDEKKYVDGFVFSAIAHLQKALMTASLENVPDSQYSAYGWKYHIFIRKTTKIFFSF